MKMSRQSNRNMDTRSWNVEDFSGKYHLSMVKTINPIPGSQVKKELERNRKKELAERIIQIEIEKRKIEMARKLQIARIGAELRSRIHVNAVAGRHIEKSERILNERESISRISTDAKNEPGEVSRFMKQVRQGRGDYLAAAIISGYKSINWQESEHGDTALHIAVSRGHINCVQILLQNGANPNILNRLGYSPLHQAWLFWKIPPLRDPRIMNEQNETTLEIIRSLLSSDADPNCRQLDGSTPLHLACRYGPLEAVKCLLGFHADSEIRNNISSTPYDVAASYQQRQTMKLLEVWKQVKRALVHVDFTMQWQRFLADYSIQASNVPTATEDLMRMTMTDNTLLLDRTSRPGFLVDDPLLQEVRDTNALHDSMGSPSLISTMDDTSPRSRYRSTSGGRSSSPASCRNISNTGVGNTRAAKQQLLFPASVPDEEGFNSGGGGDDVKSEISDLTSRSTVDKFRRMESDLARQCTPQTLAATRLSTGSARNTRSSYADRRTYLSSDRAVASEAQQRRDGAVAFSAADRGTDLASYFGVVAEEGEEEGEGDNDIVPLDDMPNIPGGGGDVGVGMSRPVTSNYLFSRPGTSSSAVHRPNSEVGQRIKAAAQRTALDGKFLLCTKRASTASAISVASRTRDAPLAGTEEQSSLSRILTTKIRDMEATTDIFRKDIAKATFMGTKPRPSTTPIGAYLPASHGPTLTERDKLLSRLADKSPIWEIKSQKNVVSDKLVDISSAPTVMEGKRKLFTETKLLPPKKEFKNLDEVKARIISEAAGHGTSSTAETVNDKSGSYNDLKSTIEAAKDLSLSIEDAYSFRSKVPNKPVVVYGPGRLQSSHMSKQILESPWSSVQSNYRCKVSF